MRPHPATAVMALAALLGLLFAGWSTADFVQHLDRQVHAIHCSFVPGLAAADASGSSGCHVALMSPWSSVWRARVWGGVPVSLPGMAVFAYLLWRAVDAWVRRREVDRDVAAYTVAAWLLPVLVSIGFGYVAIVELDTFCRTCAGIYGASFLGFAGAVAAWLAARRAVEVDVDADTALSDAPPAPPPSPWPGHAGRFAEGVGFVVLPVVLYVAMAPDFSSYLGACGELSGTDDPYGVLVPIGPQQGTPAIEVLDPLCPACAGMEERLEGSGLASRLARRAVLFPLDSACNWMINSAIHPGACTVSEAVLCAGDDADAVLAWAFAHAEDVRVAAKDDPDAAARLVTEAFPALRRCVGTAEVRQRLNRSLRWAVAHELPILTPQLYVDGVKVCDDDTDLGLEWSLSRLLARAEAP